jgi:hypothetical protein
MEGKTLVRKLAEVMLAVERIPKRGRNDFHKYDYATEADIAATVRKELADRHVMLVPSIVGESRHAVGEKGSVLTVLEMEMEFLDGESGESLKKPWRGYGTDKEDKGGYKAMTGGEKYFLLKTFLMPTGDDPEATTKDERSDKRQQDKSTVKPDRETKKARVMPDAAKAEGAVFIEKVIPKSRGNQEWAELVLSTGESIVAREHGAISLAVNLAQSVDPVLITTHKNGKGNTELDEIARWRPVDEFTPAPAEHYENPSEVGF